MEIRDLYDENRVLTGETIVKGQKYPNNRKILVVAIWIQNQKGEFLIQKRSEQKDGKWATTGGHPTTGQSSLEGIVTEVQEEIGLDISYENLALFDTNFDEKVFCDLYYLKKDVDISNLILQKEEVSEVKWATIEEINKLYELKMFKKSHYEMFETCLAYLKTRT